MIIPAGQHIGMTSYVAYLLQTGVKQRPATDFSQCTVSETGE